MWERVLGPAINGTIEIPLRFRVFPGVWPDIVLGRAEGTVSDVSAPAYELRFRCDVGDTGRLTVDVAGFRFSLLGRGVAAGESEFMVPGVGPIRVTLRMRGEHGVVSFDEVGPIPLSARAAEGLAVAPVTANIADFRLLARDSDVGTIEVGPGAEVRDAKIFGLREPESSLYQAAFEASDGPGALFYESDRFAVFDGCVVDKGAADQAAIVTDRLTIVSPIRVVEEFAWRDNQYGDMTRVADRREMWRSAVEPGRFPALTTSFRTVDAAFELAVETFQRNSSDEFALPGDAGMWSAGFFQGPGQGFGVWRRDTAHIALRTGNLLDPDVARASLAHVAVSGFDNGSDGNSLPAVAIWDYYLATGDVSLIRETWEGLVELASALDARYDEGRDLVAAPQSTSNDLFDEPEAGGFALSTEVYSMQTYDSMSRMAALPAIADERARQWAERASRMRTAIIAQYWSAEHGIFTSGPVGSESFAKGHWETSGAEAVLWGFLGAEVEPLTRSVLDRMHEVAMSDYGVVLFPYRQGDDHFSGSVWYCWQAGIARAASRVGDVELVHRLIAQQVRTVIRNKTFYEVTDAATGESWRWPGQLWHAAGFASLVLFGVLGIRYDVDGLTFTPAVPPEFDGARIGPLRYRAARLDVEVRGHGSRCDVTIDGRPVDRVDPDTVGRHTVVLTMR